MNCKDLQKLDNRKISIITNFGCRANCWYCIWKDHKLKNVNPETDFKKLEGFLEQYKYKGKVSLSGGGDCLFNFRDHKIWWKQFIDLVKSKNLKLDIHTREKIIFLDPTDEYYFNQTAGTWFNKNINRVVFSSDHLDICNNNISQDLTDRQYLKWLGKYTKVRVVHLVTKNTSFGMIEDYLKFCDNYGFQFTIKHLVGYDDGNMYTLIKTKYSNIFYLDDGDYNIYYMPDNTIREKFLY